MKRIIIVPITETGRFPGMEILALGGSVAALVGDTFEARTRIAFDSDDSFFYSVGHGQADLYTFQNLEEAACFAKGKIEALTTLELSLNAKIQNSTGSVRITPRTVPNSERSKKRA
jgi:hypothetical protein